MHGASHRQLLNTVKTKDTGEEQNILSATLCQRTYELAACNCYTCQDVMMGLQSTIGTKV